MRVIVEHEFKKSVILEHKISSPARSAYCGTLASSAFQIDPAPP